MKFMRPAAMLCALTVTLGGVGVLAATQGSQDDPLLTLSYLEKVLKPQLETQVDQAVEKNSQELAKQLDQAIAGYESRVDEQLAAAGTGAFQTKSLAKGEQFTPGAGREVLVVSGEVTALGQLTDTTAGTAVQAGDKLTAGHLYVTAAAGAGCKATNAASVMSR